MDLLGLPAHGLAELGCDIDGGRVVAFSVVSHEVASELGRGG